MKVRFLIIAALGLALALYLVMFVGAGAVFAAAAAVDWKGFAILNLYTLAVFPLLGAAWFVLLPPAGAGGVRAPVFVWARMVRDAATDILPFSQLGGIVLGARAAILHGVSRPLAYGSVIVDVTTELLAQIAFIAVGVAFLSLRAPRSPFAATLTDSFLVVLVLAVLAGTVFVLLQRRGHALTQKLASRLLPGAVATTAAVGAALDDIYRSPLRVGGSSALHLVAWFASALWTWLALRLIGVHADPAAVIALEALVCAARSAAVAVPHALGVQEAAYGLLAPLLGIGAEYGLAISLLKRARDIVTGAPLLLIWQVFEGRRALGAGAGADAP